MSPFAAVESTPPLQPWYWRSLALEGRSGSDIFAALFQHHPIATLLESPNPKGNPASELVSPHSRYSICAGAPRSVQEGDSSAPRVRSAAGFGGTSNLRLWTPPIGQIFHCLTQRWQEGVSLQALSSQTLSSDTRGPDHLPFTGGWLGWLGYDAAWEIETLPWLRDDSLPFPVAFWYEPEAFAVLDHQTQDLWLAASTPTALDQLESKLAQPSVFPFLETPPFQNKPLSLALSQPEFEERVRVAKAHIYAGDIFQANLSVRFQASGTLHPWLLYQTLQQINPSPFASYWQTPWGCIVSCSPERLVDLRQGCAQTRPIAGTRPRGTTPSADQTYRQDLLASPKERAEHTMLVDLERNDLGRVCVRGSVQVDEFLTIEAYSHVMHLVSNIKGQLAETSTPIDLIRAVFPGGTITGCPKVRCMEIIETLEPLRRSLFYGSCGYLDIRGALDLNILIRTLLMTSPTSQPGQWHQPCLHPAQIWGQVGAGIVADSDPTQEWLESLQKAQAQWIALQKMAEYSC